MRYRMLDNAGDYTFGKGPANFHKDTPAAVGQAVITRLKLIKGEWFLDTTRGTPYSTQILGAGTIAKYDTAIQSVISATFGVTGIVSYSSQVEPKTRRATVQCTISTIYGQTSFQTAL